MRLHEAVKLHDKFKDQLESSLSFELHKPLKLSNGERRKIRNTALKTLSKYLKTFYRNEDANYDVFHDYFYSMLTAEAH